MTGPVVAERFAIESVAGEGGMGVVYRARDERTQKTVALKVVKGEFANARFVRECEVLARLDHPAIVRHVDHGRIDEHAMYLAMEWIDGEPLDAFIERGPMEIDAVLALGMATARALQVAHEAGVIHRDVKPGNVVLRGGRPEDPVLLDFGIARPFERSRELTAKGALVGTPAYMAPEQVRGESALDARADTFSLGCILHECVTGRAVFEGAHLVAVFAKVLLEPAPLLRSLRPDVPSALEALVASMLEKVPERRPASMAEVIERLANVRTAIHEPLAPARMSIGPAELRLATVLLARPEHDAAVVTAADTLEGITLEDAVAGLLPELGMRVHRLRDGTLVGLLAVEDSGVAAVRVVRAARRLAEALPGAGIAVATVRALVAGSLPVGRAIDDAARLLTAWTARPVHDGVVVCGVTAALVEDRFEIERDDGWNVVCGERAVDARLFLGKPTPFVGRLRELTLLMETVRECIDEPVARATILVAPPGTGKSRLARELAARLDDEGTRAWTANAELLASMRPLALAGDLLRRALGLGDDLDAHRRRLVERAKALGLDDAEGAAARLAEITGAPFDDARDEALRAARRDPTRLAAQVEDAFVELVRAELATGPLVLLLEDVHASDAASLRLVASVLRRCRERPLFVLALARPEIDAVHPRLWEEHRCQRLSLEPLLKSAAERLARAVLGDDPPLVETIVRRAAGNPLFVEELSRAAVEGRSTDALPPTVAAVTEARIAALPAESRRALRAASVFGERFWRGAMGRLMGVGDVAMLDETLAALESREVDVRESQSRFASDVQYVFRHALVRDAAYGMLTESDRAVGHSLAAEWLADRIDDGALLARHYELGQRPADAARAHARAAEQALAANDLDAVFVHAAKAGDAPAALIAKADAHLWRAANREAAEAAEAALAKLAPGSETWFAGLGLAIAANGKRARVDRVTSLVSLLESTEPIDDAAGRARAIARARACIQLAYLGEIARADVVLVGCEREPGAAGDASVLAWINEASCERGNAAGEPVHPSDVRRGRDLSRRLGDRRVSTGQALAESQLLSSIGAVDEAVTTSEAVARELGVGAPSGTAYVAMAHGCSAARRGDVGPLLAFAERVHMLDNTRGLAFVEAHVAQELASVGRIDEAQAHATSALAAKSAAPCFETLATAVLARVAAAKGDREKALSLSAAALSALPRGLLVSGLGTLYLARIEALSANGDGDGVRAVVEEALAAFERRSRRLAEYRDGFYRAFDVPAVLAIAKTLGVSTSRA